jgi:hypothetical protein
MKKCWAASLGGCSDKMSGEHIVSAGIFPGDKVSVQGLPWCLDAPKEIGLASFVKNILCTEHNNRLSPVDEAGIQTFKTINEFIRLGHVRSSVPVRRWTVKKFDVDGINFERWCLKTLINLTVDGPARIGPRSQPNVPHHELVGICFGLTEFRHPAGMYVSWAPGDKVDLDEKLTTLFANDPMYLMGATLYLCGFRFHLYIGDRELKPGPVNFAAKDGTIDKQGPPMYRYKAMNFTTGKYLSHTMRFHWSDRRASA